MRKWPFVSRKRHEAELAAAKAELAVAQDHASECYRRSLVALDSANRLSKQVATLMASPPTPQGMAMRFAAQDSSYQAEMLSEVAILSKSWESHPQMQWCFVGEDPALKPEAVEMLRDIVTFFDCRKKQEVSNA